jgi:nucleotidyltransferase/DNA polymerase involved in DNA repair
MQVTDILARLAVCEKASIDECYLDISVEARRRLLESGIPQLPVNSDRAHICGEVPPPPIPTMVATFPLHPNGTLRNCILSRYPLLLINIK